MATTRHQPEKIATKLQQVEVLTGQGMARIDAIRGICITEQTDYRWRKPHGGKGADQLKKPKCRQKDNQRIRKAVSDLTPDKLVLMEPPRDPRQRLHSTTFEPRLPQCLR